MSKLPNAPLQEVIFELRWELETQPQTGTLVDPEYDFALGRFKSIAKDGGFPHHQNKFSISLTFNLQPLPQQHFPFQAVHQFWTGQNVWPLMQLGPGILTVNDNDLNYDWDANFLPNIEKGIEFLSKAYDAPLKFNYASLKYIDSILVKNYVFENWEAFIEENLNFKVQSHIGLPVEDFNHLQAFKTEKGDSLQFSVSSGKTGNGETALIWQTSIEQNKNITEEDLLKWLNESHKLTSETFKQFCKDTFYGSFGKK